MLAYFRPLPTNLGVKGDYLAVLFICPFIPFDFGVEFVYEPLPDLLSCLSAQHLRENFPVFAHFLDEFANGLILFSRPNLLVVSLLSYSPVAVQALVLIAVLHT